MKNKVLILGKLPPPYYGPAIATEIILKSKLKEKFNLIHFDTTLNKSVDKIGKLSFFKIINILKLYIKFFITLIKEKPVLVLVPISQSTFGLIKDSPFIILPKIIKIKVIIHLRGSYLRTLLCSLNISLRKILMGILKFSDGAIVLGNTLRYIFKDIIEEEKIFVVPNGADYYFPQRKVNDNKIRILFLANLLRSKGIEDVVEAIEILSNKLYKSIEINIFGSWRDFNLKKEIEEKINKNKLPIKIYEPISGKRKLQILVDSDIFVFPPREPEGHPWVIVEAMAAGLPIISTAQGAIIESVIDGKNGFIVEPKQPKQIADKLELLIKNKTLRINMGKASKELYEQKFTENKMVLKLTEVFEKVLEF